jgi:hypothetical protein
MTAIVTLFYGRFLHENRANFRHEIVFLYQRENSKQYFSSLLGNL